MYAICRGLEHESACVEYECIHFRQQRVKSKDFAAADTFLTTLLAPQGYGLPGASTPQLTTIIFMRSLYSLDSSAFSSAPSIADENLLVISSRKYAMSIFHKHKHRVPRRTCIGEENVQMVRYGSQRRSTRTSASVVVHVSSIQRHTQAESVCLQTGLQR